MKNKKGTNVLGIKFDSVTMDEALETCLKFLNGKDPKSIYTVNPEIVMKGKEDESFKKVVNDGDLVIADGIGVVIASKIIKKPLPERVAGYDLVQNIFRKIKNTELTVYFFGAAPGVAEQAKKNMMNLYNGLKIIGTHSGYYNLEEEKKMIEEIKKLKPDLLLVGLGAPKQEKWIDKHINELGVKVCIGVGGSFDVMSGNVKRAPKIFIKLGLEWFYRLITQPTRFVRMLKIPMFLIEVILFGKKYK